MLLLQIIEITEPANSIAKYAATAVPFTEGADNIKDDTNTIILLLIDAFYYYYFYFYQVHKIVCPCCQFISKRQSKIVRTP